MATVFTPAAVRSSTTPRAAFSSDTKFTATLYPLRPNNLAIAAPMPRLPPVTITMLCQFQHWQSALSDRLGRRRRQALRHDQLIGPCQHVFQFRFQ